VPLLFLFPAAPPEIFVDPEIKLTQQGSKSLKLHWRKFSPSERELIDGIQVTYKANDDKVSLHIYFKWEFSLRFD